jgi:hypothetical protein
MAEQGHEAIACTTEIGELIRASRRQRRDNEERWGRTVRYPLRHTCDPGYMLGLIHRDMLLPREVEMLSHVTCSARQGGAQGETHP